MSSISTSLSSDRCYSCSWDDHFYPISSTEEHVEIPPPPSDVVASDTQLVLRPFPQRFWLPEEIWTVIKNSLKIKDVASLVKTSGYFYDQFGGKKFLIQLKKNTDIFKISRVINASGEHATNAYTEMDEIASAAAKAYACSTSIYPQIREALDNKPYGEIITSNDQFLENAPSLCVRRTVLRHCNLTHFPEYLIKCWPKLDTLVFSDNRIEDLPWEAMENLENLKILNVGNNDPLQWVPDWGRSKHEELQALRGENRPNLSGNDNLHWLGLTLGCLPPSSQNTEQP